MTITAKAIERLEEMGAKRWTKGNHDRLYLSNCGAEIIGLEVSRYNTGNISSATLNGEKISNSKAYDVLSSFEKAYIDLSTGELCGVSNRKGLGDDFAVALENLVDSINAEDEAEEAEAIEETAKEEITVLFDFAASREDTDKSCMRMQGADRDGNPTDIYAEVQFPMPKSFREIADGSFKIGEDEYRFNDFCIFEREDTLENWLSLEESENPSDRQEAADEFEWLSDPSDFMTIFDIKRFKGLCYSYLRAEIATQAQEKGLNADTLEYIKCC